jgi:iron complex outermembrane receptor protein
MHKSYLLLFFLFLVQLLSAQTIPIQIELSENKTTPIVGATVKLTDRSDTIHILFAITDQAGKSVFEVQLNQQYTLDATYTGLKPLQKGITITDQKKVFRFIMAEDATALEGVTIKAKKPLMRQEDDKTIVDPEVLAESSNNVYEIIEKTPGLFIDQDGNVYLNSATPATIYINGREQKMSASDIASMLKSLPPNSVERLEIIRTPSAKYDASGGSGIVNVVLKKGVKIGRTGSANAGLNQGRFGNQNVGFTLNNSDGGRTSNLNVNYSHRNSYDQLITTRQLTADSSLTQDAYSVLPGQNLYLGYGLGFEPADKWEVDLDGRVNYGLSNTETTTNNQIVRQNNAEILNDNQNNLFNDGRNFSLNQGLAAKFKIDTIGSELTGDLSYNFQDNHTNQDFDLISLIPSSTTALGGAGDIGSNRYFLAAKIDLKYKLHHSITLESGLKSAIQDFKNATAFTLKVNGISSPDPFRTNTFHFRESIHAAYLQASKPFSGFILKVGTRLENTNMEGRQVVPSDTAFQIHRTDLFPYVYLSHRVMAIAGYELRGYLVCRRSISRPSYSYLNPFPRFLDQYLYESGNPALRPQFTQNYEFNISFDEMPILALGRNYTTDIFTNVIYQDPGLPGVAYRTYDNLGKNEETYFKLVGALPPGGAYFFVAGAQYNYNKYNGLYENQPLTFNRGSWSFFTYHQLKLGNRSMLTLNGFFRLKGQQQFYELSNFGGVAMTLNRQFLDKKLTVTLSANDIFYTNRNTFQINQGNIEANGERRGDTRRVGVNVRYNFGLKKREERGNMFNYEGEN